ncbi:hypothetical protein GA0070624_0817 [Micromonospora rhizosphaerae]|uniref:Uncharacterized protein n=1 Tax=Micromonospora rhizosphaerae TaxID=568872 RepID=A0A1C6RF80_9ACTN|nr:hypothetical protein [Micromonospora rhizosphaerae]SCL15764.1 hypothetical protein GA0070624_0817 [Micromonospora rhizosphaerae]
MSYRDWGSGEGSPRERQPTASWDDPGEPVPADPYASGTERYRTPSRRRAIERGQQEPVDNYLPRWALESGVRRADGGGRHAAPDDDDDEFDPPRPDGGWRADTGWRREAGRALRTTIDAGADHTGEWTVDTEQGYVGSRRAESSKDEPVSGPPRSRPRRSRSRRPQVIWSGLAETPAPPEGEADRWDTRRSSRRATADSWSRPGVDSWARSAEQDPAERPAVDPWDASGVHAWDRSATGGRWDQTDGTGRWDQPDKTGEWDGYTDTGQWDRYTDTGEWSRYADAGRRDRYAEVDRWDRSTPAPVRQRVAEGWAATEQAEGFWSGTRLASDDPRWMDTPTSAPRSPVIGYTAPRPRTVPRQRRVEAVSAGRRAGAASIRRRMETFGGGSWSRRLEDDLLDPDPGGPIRPLVYTAACYLVPALLVFVWLLTLDGQAPPGCVTDITGGGCDSPRTHAFGSLIAGTPRFGLALVSSLVVAVLLRRVGTTWRSATVALAAAVVGGGLSTVLISAVTGQPIG